MTLLSAFIASVPACAGDPEPSPIRATAEWITLSPDSHALWIEGSAPDGPILLELKPADDTVLVIATRETIAREGHFSSLLRPTRLPAARYSVEIRSGREAIHLAVARGTEEEQARYAQLELAFFGDACEQVRSLTRELHRVFDEHLETRDRNGWDAWAGGWRRRHEEVRTSLQEFRNSRGVLARAADYYQLISSLCFAKTLLDIYAAELSYAEGEPGGAEEWALALDEQFETFQERRQTPTRPDFERWTAELGSEDCSARERATRSLARAGEKARLFLELAAGSDDPEVAERARDLLRRLPQK